MQGIYPHRVAELVEKNLESDPEFRGHVHTPGWSSDLQDEKKKVFDDLGDENFVCNNIGNRLTVNFAPGSTGNVVYVGAISKRPLQVNVSGSNNVVIVGSGNRFGINVRIQGDNALYFSGNGAAATTVSALVSDGRSVVVGDGCFLAGGVQLRTTDAHAVLDLGSGKQINPPQSVLLGAYVWMAMGSSVLKGRRIGRGSVIGAGAVVTKDIPPFSLVVGSPGKVVRENVGWSHLELPDEAQIERRIEELGWTDPGLAAPPEE